MRRNIRLLYWHNFLTCFRFQQAYTAIFFSQILGSYTAGMMILAIENVSSAILDIPTGIMSDKIGRTKTIALGSLCMTLGVACYAAAHAAALLALGAVLCGCSSCLFNGNNTAMLYETLQFDQSEGHFHHFHGKTGSMTQLALGVSAICSCFMTPYGLRLIFIAGIIPQMLATGVSFGFVDPPRRSNQRHETLLHLREALAQIKGNPKLLLVMIGQAFSFGAGEASFHFRNVFISQLWPMWALGIYRSVNNAGGVLGFWFSGKLIDRLKAPFLLVISEAFWTVTHVIAALIANVFSPAIFMTGCLFYGLSVVATDKLMQDEFTDAQRATMGSVATFVGSILYAITALVIGAVSDHFGVARAVLFGVLFGSLGLPAYWLVFRPRKKLAVQP
ncbi:MAG: MFS transporter [Alphaproteobacteria bacterium]|nr:MFS transporter [Alphaproteobacteria bacterium]